MSGVKAIDTVYKGYRFRSRTEARWAVFFDTLGVDWEYEKEGFDLGVHGRYLPDFWMPSLDAWVEIKGEEPTPVEIQKATALAEASQRSVHVFWGRVEQDPFWARQSEGNWGALTIHPSCKCGYLKLGVHAKWTSWLLCHACDAPLISDTASPCPCRPAWYHCKKDRAEYETRERCYLDQGGRRRRCRHDDAIDKAYAAAKSARFEHGENGSRLRFSRQSSYDRRLDGWATKVYGEEWDSWPGYEAASERFDSWLESRGEQ